MVLLTSVFLIVFTAAYSFVEKNKSYAANGDETNRYYLQDGDGIEISTNGYTMRKREDNFSIPTTDNLDITFTLSSSDILEIENNTGIGPVIVNSNSLKVKATHMGQVALTITAKKHGTNDIVLDNITYQITVAFSINEQISTNDNPNVRMLRLFREQDTSDERNNRKALIMTYDEDSSGSPTTYIAFGSGADKSDELKYLNLTFGDARTRTPNIEWQSGNEDIISIEPDFTVNGETENRGRIIAEGAGRTTLSVTWQDGTMTYQDEIYVFVRPKITIDGKNVGTDSGSGNGSNPLTVTNGTKINVSVKSQANELVGIKDKLAWVIAKPAGEGTVLVRDSLGNSTKDYEDEANLEWLESENCYRVNAKAGTYFIQFFVVGTYKDFDTATDADYCQCKPVSVINGVYVGSEFKNYNNRYVRLNVGGQFNFPEAFNITNNTFDECFDVTITGVTNPTGGAIEDVVNGAGIISFASGQLQKIINADKLGTVTIQVTSNDNIAASELRDIDSDENVYITIVITDTFSLNYSDVEMSIGSELALWGVLASGSDAGSSDEVEYKWDTDDTSKCIEINNEVRDHATVKALKTTKSGTVNVMLYRTQNGVTLVANCSIRVNSSTASFHIVPSKLTMKIGETQTITTDLKDPYTLAWLSSDTSVVTVNPSQGATLPSAQVTAKKTGSAILTAVNAANNVYAICMITVEQPVTELKIGVAGKEISDPYTVELAQGFVFMEALYTPSNATEKNFTWESSDKTVATVDSTGKVTLLKEGSTTIKVRSSNASGTVTLNVVTPPVEPPVVKPLTSIKPDATELNMIKGDTHTINLTLEPRDATDTNVTWTSLDEKVAKVDATGKITAVGVGTTNIIVEAVLANSEGNKAKAPAIKVNVRDKLQSIAFESKATYINVGGTKQMEIIYKPDENVNKDVTFKSSDTSIFTVDNKGVIKGVAVGQAVLSCESKELGQAGVITCMVTVTASEIPAKDFSVTPAAETIYIGATLQLTKKFNPENATNQTVTWSSSDTSIATVNTTGTVKAVKEGKATISAVYTDTKDNKPLIRTSTITVEAAPIPVTSFDINPDTSNIIVGDKFTITPVFKPNDATNKNVEYQSLDEGVIKVSDKGEVTGVGAGDAIIQCQAEDGGFIATCFVHVDNAVEFSLSPSTKSIVVGRTFKLKKVINPANAKKAATWSTSNSSIATVDQDGNVTAKRLGKCTITCKLTKYNQRARCRVKVEKLKSSIGVTNKNIRIGVGQSYKLKNTITTNDTKKPKLSWKTANKRVASVNKNGKIKGKRVGKTKITVTTSDGVRAKATCKVRVIQRVSSIRLNSDYVEIYTGKSKKLKAKRKPSNATIKKIKWTSGDENIVRVRPSGKIRAVAVGNTYITAAATDGSKKKARCYVKVLESVPATSIVVAQSKLTLQRGDSTGLTYKVLPDGNTDKLKFASDNKRVVTVNKNGRVTAVGTGDATVTILASSGVSSEVNINVVALNKSSITMRQYDTETLEVLGASSNVTWYSSNANVATIDSSGKVSGKSIGTTTVYAYIDGCRLSCTVTITSL